MQPSVAKAGLEVVEGAAAPAEGEGGVGRDGDLGGDLGGLEGTFVGACLGGCRGSDGDRRDKDGRNDQEAQYERHRPGDTVQVHMKRGPVQVEGGGCLRLL